MEINMTTGLNRRDFFPQHAMSRRLFLAVSGAASLRFASAAGPVRFGMAVSSVAEEFGKDPLGTLRAVAKMGHQVVEFSTPRYLHWTTQQAKDVRKVLDDVGMPCHSTHNYGETLTAEQLPKIIELNHIIGSKCVIASGNKMGELGEGAEGGKVPGGLDGFKRLADRLTVLSKKITAEGLQLGYHNHTFEFIPIDGKIPMELVAANTPKEVLLQLDAGPCVQAKADPVAWIKANPGRIRSIHCKDWAPGPGNRVIFGEGVTPWREIFAAAESVGGTEDYLIEQLGSPAPDFEVARRSVENWKKLRG